jgi:Ca2+/Na+ antiporter
VFASEASDLSRAVGDATSGVTFILGVILGVFIVFRVLRYVRDERRGHDEQ